MSEKTFYVSPAGSDDAAGTQDHPFATLARAREAVREHKQAAGGAVTVLVREGTHYLAEPLVFGPGDSGSEDGVITYAAYPGEQPVLSGGRRIAGEWRPYKDGIWMCSLPEATGGLDFDQLFVNGRRVHRARFPNYDAENPRKNGGGYILSGGQDGLPPTELNFDPKTFDRPRYAHPKEAVLHCFQTFSWGNLIWRLRGIDYERNCFLLGRGGWQMNTLWSWWAACAGEAPFYIENVFEELDAPGEWYLDRREGVLYYMPLAGEDMTAVVVEAPLLTQVAEFRGSQDEPVRHITLRGFKITHTAAVYLEPWEAPSLGDWTIHRSGAVFFEGAEDCGVEDSFFYATGGNAVFMSNYNRRNRVSGCTFTETGESAVCLLGTNNTRFGSNEPFPAECVVHNNHIHNCGIYGKQTAGVFLSRCEKITVSHNEIHDLPRAAVCINDGTWGGHAIEHNRLYDTCLESGDHGPFNSWGRDRYWCLQQSHGPNYPSHPAGNVLEDARHTTEIRYNYVEDREWGIDLDDGTSNYRVHHNVCVGCPIKFREGALRTAENNIIVDTGHSVIFSLGYEDNGDRFVRNIISLRAEFEHDHDYGRSKLGKSGVFFHPSEIPIRGPWAEEIDHNCFWSDTGQWWACVHPGGQGERPDDPPYALSLEQWRQLGYDRNSVFADPLFVDPANGDWSVRPDSPALKLGFENFPMDAFGLLPDFPRHWEQ